MLFTSGMVLQQNAKTTISGGAPANSSVVINFCQKQYKTKVSTNGRWRITIDCGKSCGPENMEICCSNNEQLLLTDVYVGEVWICSGQSNMQLTMERLRYKFPEDIDAPKNNKVRMFTVPVTARYNSAEPVLRKNQDKKTQKDDSIIDFSVWQAASSETIADFSGSAYFFAKNLAAKLDVPVGIISAAQGGSPITSWMGAKSLEAFPEYAKRRQKCLSENYREEIQSKIAFGLNRWNDLCNKNDIGTFQNWHKIPFENEKTLKLPGSLANENFAGVIWLQKEINITAEQLEVFKTYGVHLWLGTIVDVDFVWVNGTKVGTTWYLYPPRRYQFDVSLLHEGKNRIAVRVVSSGRSGGARFISLRPYALFSGDIIKNTDWQKIFNTGAITKIYEPNLLKEKIAKGSAFINLEGEWQSRISCSVEPRSDEHFFEWEPSALYYGMLEQCFDYAVRGALWYQGESNAEKHFEYSDLLVNMIKDWRENFANCPNKEMIFIIAELPCFNEKNLLTDKCDWAFLREKQEDAAKKLENVAVASLIDCGEWNELHPEDKSTVGRRCAEQALRLAYKDENAPLVPKAIKFSREKNTNVFIKIECGDDELVSNNAEISGFTVLAKDKEKNIVLPVKAMFSKENELNVDLSSAISKNLSLIELRYLFVDCPPEICLFSKNGKVPLQPFRVNLSRI